MPQNQEKRGVFFALVAAAMWGAFPVLVNYGAQSIPPIVFAATTTFLAAITAFFYAAVKGHLHELKNTKAYSSLIAITLCIVVIPYTLFFIGSAQTSGINSSLLLLSEIVFTLLFTPFIGEKTTKKKLLGAFGVSFGAVLILYNGTFSINTGDLLIILSTLTYPLGNFYAKKAFHHVSTSIILFVRFLLGSVFLFSLSFVLEDPLQGFQAVLQHWEIVAVVGVVLLGIGKVIWYEGLKRLDISKAISISITFPLFSLLFLVVFFQEIPSVQQWVGILFMALGIYFSITSPVTNPSLTKYGKQ